MTKRISLDDPKWSESTVGESTAIALKSWLEESPSIEEYSDVVEKNSCSDLLYKSFYYALPYFVDELEKRKIRDQFEMAEMLNWKLVRAYEGNPDQESLDHLEAQAERVIDLLVRLIMAGCPSSLMQESFAAIAGIQGHSALAEAIFHLDL